MYIKDSEKKLQKRENARGGKGTMLLHHLFDAQTVPNVSLAGVLTFEPGVTLGQHDHTGETEIYYILSGELVVDDNGQERIVHAGDTIVTGGGDYHSVRNESNEPASFLAIIVTE